MLSPAPCVTIERTLGLPNAPMSRWLGQSAPAASLFTARAVVSGESRAATDPTYWSSSGGQSTLVPSEPTASQLPPAFFPESHVPPTQRGQGESGLLVTKMRAESEALSVELNARRSACQHASSCTTLTMQEDRNATEFGSGSGGPKKQLASSAQAPPKPPQSASPVHAPWPSVPANPLMQWRPGPAALVQSLLEVPAFGPRTRLSPCTPTTPSTVRAPSGMRPPPISRLRPPPR